MRKLPEAELKVMAALWDAGGEAGSEELLSAVDEPWSRTTLLTLLKRLESRGFVTAAREGRVNRYRAAVAREAYLETEGESLLDRLCNHSIREFVRAMYDGERISPEELEDLRPGSLVIDLASKPGGAGVGFMIKGLHLAARSDTIGGTERRGSYAARPGCPQRF